MAGKFPPNIEPFVLRLKELYPETSKEILSALSHRDVQAIRVNTLKTTDDRLLASLQSNGFTFTPVTAIAHAYIRTDHTPSKLSQVSEWKQGLFVIQSLSSQLVSLIVDPQPNELILDACASPGSKTSHLAMLMGNTGTIVANDSSHHRLMKLKHVLDMVGVPNAVLVNLPAEILWRDYENTFDRVLVDVPCTMEGRIDLQDEDTYADWSIKKIKRLSTEQKGILRSAIRCVKPGGTIIYSTCTLTPEENEEVIDWVLRKEESLELLPITTSNVPRSDAILSWQNTHYRPEIKHCLRILPSREWEGFFVAKLRKKLQ